MSDDRTCENCRRTLDRGDIRQRDRKTGRLVCSVCLAHPIEQPNKIDVTATRKVAHDGGDGQVIYHCPFCGSGGVVARSDGSTECTVCQQYFTIQVQPRNRNSPQTVNGEPVHIPGMPEESEIAPVGGNNVPVPVDQQDAVVPGFSDPEMDEEEFLTAAGARLARQHYVQHLALGVSKDPVRTMGSIRQANLKTAQALPTAYCMRCTEEDLPPSWLCRRPGQEAVIDHGPDHDPDLARYEGICQRCCGHNHG